MTMLYLIPDASPNGSLMKYKIYGVDDNGVDENITSEDGKTDNIVMKAYTYAVNKDKTYEPIDIKDGTYKKIKIDISSPSSWIAIQELMLY